jgi:hypothetical protein
MALCFRIESTSVEVEAVFAAEVAVSGGGFYEERKRFALLNTIFSHSIDVLRLRG